MEADLLIHNIGQLVTLAGPPGARRGRAMRELGAVERGAVAARDGLVIVGGGRAGRHRAAASPPRALDAGGRAVIPGFVDPHTHLPWAGHRASEFESAYRRRDVHGDHGRGRRHRPHGDRHPGRVARPTGRGDGGAREADARIRHDDRRGEDRLRAERRGRAEATGGHRRAAAAGSARPRADLSRRARGARGVSRPDGRVRRPGGRRDAAGCVGEVAGDQGGLSRRLAHLLRRLLRGRRV